MQTNQAQASIQGRWAIVIFFYAVLISFASPDSLLTTNQLLCVLLLPCLFFCKSHPTNQTTTTTLPLAWFKLIAYQMAFYVVLATLALSLIHINPSLPALANFRLEQSWLFTLAPWLIYALVTVCFMRCCQQARPLSITALLGEERSLTSLHFGADIIMRYCVSFSMGITVFALIAGVFSQLPSSWSSEFQAGWHLTQCVCGVAILLLFRAKPLQQYLNQQLRQHQRLGILIAGFTLCAGLVLLVLSFLFNGLHASETLTWQHSLTAWQLVLFAWCLGLTRLLALSCQRVCQGRSSYTTLSMLLVIPCLLTAYCFNRPHWLSTLNAIYPVLLGLSIVIFLLFLIYYPNLSWSMLSGESDNSLNLSRARANAIRALLGYMCLIIFFALTGIWLTSLLTGLATGALFFIVWGSYKTLRASA